jgi:hypothetical protein
MSRSRHSVFALVVGVALGLVILIVPSVAQVDRGAPEDGGRGFSDRLTALNPADPMAYFELAEEVADVADSSQQGALAQRLFGLAGVLDAERLGRSAALALADLEQDELRRRRLLALASLLGSDELISPGLGVPSVGYGEADDEPSTAAVMSMLEAFSHYRRGKGSKALSALREEGAMELLERYDGFLRGGINGFLEDCKLYRGELRPSLSQSDLIRMLRLEVALLAGDERPWSAELMVSRGRPLIEVDPMRLEDVFAVDASRPLYRNGRWVEQDN